jgi:hypothetical protein
MQRKRQFTIRAALVVSALLAVSFGLIRAAFSDWGPDSHIDERLRATLLLVGVHLLAGTIGSSIGWFFRGRGGAVAGAVIAILGLWVVGFVLLPDMQ